MSAHVREQLSAFLDDELPPAERTAVEAHVRDCAECARRLDELGAVDALARSQEVQAPPGYFEALPGRLRARLAPRPRVRVPAWAVALAAGLVLAVLTPLTLRVDRGLAPPAAEPLRPAPAPPAVAPGTVDVPPDTLEGLAYVAPEPSKPPRSADRGRDAASKAEEARARDEARYAAGPLDVAGSRQDRAFAVAPTPAAPQESKPVAEAVTVAAESPSGPPPASGQHDPRAQAPVGAVAKRRPATEGKPLPAAAPPAAPAEAAEEALADREQEEDALVSEDAAPGRGAANAVPSRTVVSSPRPAVEEARFRSLGTRATRSAAEARGLREAWLAFVRDHPDSPHADEARVRALEAGAAAWRLGGLAEDRELVEREGRAYLRRPEATQKERVRALLAGLEP